MAATVKRVYAARLSYILPATSAGITVYFLVEFNYTLVTGLELDSLADL